LDEGKGTGRRRTTEPGEINDELFLGLDQTEKKQETTTRGRGREREREGKGGPGQWKKRKKVERGCALLGNVRYKN
jgi:hypothetical protein